MQDAKTRLDQPCPTHLPNRRCQRKMQKPGYPRPLKIYMSVLANGRICHSKGQNTAGSSVMEVARVRENRQRQCIRSQRLSRVSECFGLMAEFPVSSIGWVYV